jgi:hypothetical protein
MSANTENPLGRRRFLRAVGSASTVAVAATAAPLATIEEAQAYDPGREERRTRYQPDSPDVQAFYRTNGYETLKK